jgi:hypothetical protein
MHTYLVFLDQHKVADAHAAAPGDGCATKGGNGWVTARGGVGGLITRIWVCVCVCARVRVCVRPPKP